MGLLRVTVQVRVVEFPTTTLVRVAVTCTSGGTALEQVTQHNVTSDHGDSIRDVLLVWWSRVPKQLLICLPRTCTLMVALLVLSPPLFELRPTHVYSPSCAG